MKYSVRGNIITEDGSHIVTVLNSYALWRLVTGQTDGVFTFEAWVNTVEDKTALFNDLKPFVNEGSVIDWHECTHDELNKQKCLHVETYTRGG
jgi:hypothetical protein